MSKWPTVSVVIPYGPDFTPKKMLEAAKKSARQQNVPIELEVIYDEDAHGPAWARNQGLKRSDRRFVAFLDADDRWHRGKLERQLADIKRTGAGIAVEGPQMSQEALMRELYLGNIQSLTSSILIDSEVVTATFDESIERREDHMFILEASSESGICTCPNLFDVGSHNNSLTAETTTWYRLSQDFQFANAVRRRVPEVREYLIDYYETVHCKPELGGNTAGDLIRLIFIRSSLLALLAFSASYACQQIIQLFE